MGDPVRTTDPADGAALLAEVSGYIRTYMSMTEPQNVVVTVYSLHTHAFAAADATPYLLISSPEKECGKTRLLEVLELIVRNKWRCSRASAAVLPRKIEAEKPTLLLDETDMSFKSNKEYAAALAGALNDGYRYGAVTTMCVVKNKEITFQDFCLFCPKVITGKGVESVLDDTTVSRCIPIRLKRKKAGAAAQRFRPRDVEPRASSLRGRMRDWAATNIAILRVARPSIPEELSDRQQDIVEPLLAIADLVGGDWPVRLRSALLEMFSASTRGQSQGVELLRDLREIYGDKLKLFSKDIVAALNAMEDRPWSAMSSGKGVTQNWLAKELRPYEVSPRKIRIDDETGKGYERTALEEPWSLYIASESEQGEQINNDAGKTHISEGEQDSNVHLSKSEESPINTLVVHPVHLQGPSGGDVGLKANGREHVFCYNHPLNKGNWWARPDGSWTCGKCYPQPVAIEETN
jgi:hypothetical protein